MNGTEPPVIFSNRRSAPKEMFQKIIFKIKQVEPFIPVKHPYYAVT